MDDKTLQAFRACVADTAPERRRVRELVACGQWREAEPDAARALSYALRRRNLGAHGGPESIIGDTEDFLRASFLSQGAAVARAVAYVEVNAGNATEIATGFLVSPRLFITNQHVIADADAARGAQVSFLRELDERGVPRPTTTFLLAPESFALFSPADQLDYALVALGPRQSGNAALADLGFCPLSDQPDKHVIGMNTNIIQHPSGWMKMISVRNNTLTARTDHTLLYETDTEQGSSGSPVFNDDWQLVALHHWGEPFLDGGAAPNKGKQKKNKAAAAATTTTTATAAADTTSAARNVNEGVRISAIYRDLAARMNALPAAWKPLLQEALSYQPAAAPGGDGRQLSPPHAAAEAQAFARPDITEDTRMSRHDDQPLASFTIPLEVTVRVGGAAGCPAVSGAAAMAAPAAARRLSPPPLARGAEAVRIDQDYGNRGGYDAGFIPGVKLPLPKPDDKLAGQIAALRADEAHAADGELKYEHFSLKLLKAKRIAAFTATNIDGATYLNVNRGTGRVNEAEGDTWFQDPRVSASFYLGQDFYSAWSGYFDRGHLTRRSDPSWGTPEEAERANADTFHFTNCSPQHFRFNQSATYWQGLERYVLENGILAASARGRICVFQGPVFNDQVDMWADDVQIPSAFFKIVVWKGRGGLKSVGLLADQSKLLSESRHSLGAPQALASVDVNHWRLDIAAIEKMTGLDFGAKVRGADTIRDGNQPQVGEARILVTGFDQIKL